MKLRKVALTYEVLTDAPLKSLRDIGGTAIVISTPTGTTYLKIEQVQVNVIQERAKR